jgi:hypothetical protein
MERYDAVRTAASCNRIQFLSWLRFLLITDLNTSGLIDVYDFHDSAGREIFTTDDKNGQNSSHRSRTTGAKAASHKVTGQKSALPQSTERYREAEELRGDRGRKLPWRVVFH